MKPIYRDILALVLVALLGGVIGWYIKPCPNCIGTAVVEVRDSFASAKDTGVVAINTQPKLKETRKYSPDASHKNCTLSGDSLNSINNVADKLLTEKPEDYHEQSVSAYCLDTNIFTVDTQQVDNFKAHATATVTNNQLIGLFIEYQNFKPEKWKVMSKTVTVEKKQSLVKVFPELYARTNFNAVTVTGGGAGGGASFVIKDKHLIGIDAGANKSMGQPIDGEVLIRYGFKIHLK